MQKAGHVRLMMAEEAQTAVGIVTDTLLVGRAPTHDCSIQVIALYHQFLSPIIQLTVFIYLLSGILNEKQ